MLMQFPLPLMHVSNTAKKNVKKVSTKLDTKYQLSIYFINVYKLLNC